MNTIDEGMFINRFKESLYYNYFVELLWPIKQSYGIDTLRNHNIALMYETLHTGNGTGFKPYIYSLRGSTYEHLFSYFHDYLIDETKGPKVEIVNNQRIKQIVINESSQKVTEIWGQGADIPSGTFAPDKSPVKKFFVDDGFVLSGISPLDLVNLGMERLIPEIMDVKTKRQLSVNLYLNIERFKKLFDVVKDTDREKFSYTIHNRSNFKVDHVWKDTNIYSIVVCVIKDSDSISPVNKKPFRVLTKQQLVEEMIYYLVQKIGICNTHNFIRDSDGQVISKVDRRTLFNESGEHVQSLANFVDFSETSRQVATGPDTSISNFIKAGVWTNDGSGYILNDTIETACVTGIAAVNKLLDKCGAQKSINIESDLMWTDCYIARMGRFEHKSSKYISIYCLVITIEPLSIR